MKILCVILACVLLIIVGAIVRAFAMYLEKRNKENEQKELVRKYKEKVARGNVNRWGEYV